MTAKVSMQWSSALSRRTEPLAALEEAAAGVEAALARAPDLVLLFASSHYAPRHAELAAAASARFPRATLVGCASDGVLAAGSEVERSESLGLLAGVLPGVELHAVHTELAGRDRPDWERLLGSDPESAIGYLVLADPFSEVDAFLGAFDELCPGVPKLGGLVSGAGAPGEAALLLGDRVLHDGVVCVALRGEASLRAAVAQGCRPIGKPMIVTRCRDSVIYELDVGRPVDALRRLFDSLTPRDQELGRHSLFLGIEMSGRSHTYKQGDFLIREIAGMDPGSGAMAVHGQCSTYQVVQFHLRDPESAAHDLVARLRELPRLPGVAAQAQGALMVSCVGRGRALYGRTGHDSQLLRSELGEVPLAGFFASGEIGPVGQRTFVHGYTSVVGMIGPKVASAPVTGGVEP